MSDKTPTVVGFPPNNQFRTFLNLRVRANGTIEPTKNRSQSDFRCVLLWEYPAYEKEVGLRRQSNRLDEQGQSVFDYDAYMENRIRISLVKWSLHKVPNLTKPINRVQDQLDDQSMRAWRQLPPLIRKSILSTLVRYMGN